MYTNIYIIIYIDDEHVLFFFLLIALLLSVNFSDKNQTSKQDDGTMLFGHTQKKHEIGHMLFACS